MKRLLLVVPLVLTGLSGCGTDGDEFYAAAKGTLSQAQATALQSDLSAAVKLSFTAPSGLPGGFTRSTRDDDPTFKNCTTTTPTALVDADGDKINATKTVVFNCKDISSNGYKYSRTGTYVITDKDDSKANAGFRYEYQNVVGGHDGAGKGVEEYTYDGFFDLTQSAGNYTYTSNYQSKGRNGENRAYLTTYSSGSTWTFSVTSDDQANPTAAGTISINGFYGQKTETTGTPPAQSRANGEYVLKVVSNGLKYQSASCTNFYKEGDISFSDASGNVLKYVYTCNAVTRTYNGTAI